MRWMIVGLLLVGCGHSAPVSEDGASALPVVTTPDLLAAVDEIPSIATWSPPEGVLSVSGVEIPALGSVPLVEANDECETHTDCEAGGTQACVMAVCDEGTCVVENEVDGTPCVAGGCTSGAQCQEGACVGTPTVCDDENTCTLDICDVELGCRYLPSLGACEDGDACTVDDACGGGECLPGAWAECSDGDACNGIEVCDTVEGCVGGDAPECGDGAWHIQCGEECDDGNLISGDGCDASCGKEPELCGQGQCEDDNPCTADSCVDGLCEYNPVVAACDDGDVCTLGDTCQQGACFGGDPASCEDGLACTQDICDALEGCVHNPVDSLCESGGPCVETFCEAGVGCATALVQDGTVCGVSGGCAGVSLCTQGNCVAGATDSCDDGNPCTQDTCEGESCSHVGLSGVHCDDGDDCTAGDSCSLGTCEPGFLVSKPGCVESDAVCTVSGSAGQTVDCPVQLVRGQGGQAHAVNLQFSVGFPADKLYLEDFYDEHCFEGVGCYDLALAGEGGFGTVASGHSLIPAPASLSGWNAKECASASDCNGSACTAGLCAGTGGGGGLLLVHFADDSQPFNTAFLNGEGAVIGDAGLLWMRFQLRTDVEEPLCVEVSGLAGATGSGAALDISVAQERIVYE